ncbi:MAG: hypothetical protein NTX50_16335 [Candidatus Sumerlaeota bacterium]|nr:hypothetical protein [Candidatus Sumerlaeota bacterium]
MEHLTEDMTRLREEIGSMRRARDRFRRNTERDVAVMREGFRAAHAEMARDSQAERMVSMSGVRRAVRDVKRTVAGLRRGFAADIQGAHQAWAGGSFSGRPMFEEPRRRTAAAEKTGPQKNSKKHFSR